MDRECPDVADRRRFCTGGSYRPALSRPATDLSETVTLFRKRPVFAAAAARPLTEVDSDAMD
jgi:hypothetical protein